MKHFRYHGQTLDFLFPYAHVHGTSLLAEGGTVLVFHAEVVGSEMVYLLVHQYRTADEGQAHEELYYQAHFPYHGSLYLTMSLLNGEAHRTVVHEVDEREADNQDDDGNDTNLQDGLAVNLTVSGVDACQLGERAEAQFRHRTTH